VDVLVPEIRVARPHLQAVGFVVPDWAHVSSLVRSATGQVSESALIAGAGLNQDLLHTSAVSVPL
jgi:hypothetical protein